MRSRIEQRPITLLLRHLRGRRIFGEWAERRLSIVLACRQAIMAKPNYSGEKRRKELEKQRKKEEKKRRKLENASAPASDDAAANAEEPAADTDEQPPVTSPS